MIDFTFNGANLAVLEKQLLAGEIDRSAILEYALQLDVGASAAVRDKFQTAMSGAACISWRSDGRRYETVLRLSETLSPSREPEEMTKILSEQMGEFLRFCRVVYNENSTEVEWVDLGRAKNLVSMYVDLPVEQRPFWQAYCTLEPFETSGWNADERVPARLKQGFRAQGIQTGPVVFVPLTSPHRGLGGPRTQPSRVQSVVIISTQENNSMEAIGLLVTLEARRGKEADAEAFLKSAQSLALDEKGTLKWYAIKLGPGKFGIFDTFADERSRDAHLSGEIAKALGARANELLAVPPQIEKVEVLASTPLRG